MPSLRITTPLLFICVFFALLCDFTRAADAPAATTPEQAQALVGGLQFQQGTISIRDDLARLQVPENMRFLKGHDAATVLVQIWGNPPSAEPLGMLVPSGCDLLADCWAVIISYEEDGYVKDDDAAKINYSELLTEMQKGIRAENKERQKQG